MWNLFNWLRIWPSDSLFGAKYRTFRFPQRHGTSQSFYSLSLYHDRFCSKFTGAQLQYQRFVK